MANNRISVLIDVTVDKANRALTDFKTKVNEADGAVGKFKAGTKSAMDSLRANSGAAATVAGAALFKFGTDAVDAASSLEQSIGGIEKSFGDTAEAVLAIGRNADESMGLSERAFNEGALALSAFAEDIARDTGEPVEKVIADLMTRAADFAAAYGTTVPEAVRIFSSTLSGESEPIKRFGIIINETETKAYAAEAGIEDMGKATQRAGLLMRDTAKFAGQFDEESDTLAGTQERLGAKIENLQAQLGQELLPVVADVTGGVGDLIDGWNALGELPPVKMVIDVTGNDTLLGTLKSGLDATAGIPGMNYAVDKITGTFKKWDSATLATSGTIGDLTGDVSDNTSEVKDNTRAFEGGVAGMTDAERAAGYLRSEVDEVTDSFSELRDEISEENAYLDAADGFDKVREAAFDAYTAAADGSVDAEAKARDYERAINDQQLEVLDLIEAIGGVPESTTANILALIDQGKVDEAELILEGLARSRNAELLVFPKLIGALPASTPFTVAAPGRAAGGPVSAGGTYVVGEKGPELLQMGSSSGNVIPNNKLGTGGGSTFNVTINADPNPDVTVRKLREWVRRNGPIQGLT